MPQIAPILECRHGARRDDKGPPARPDDLGAAPSGLPVFAHTHLEHEAPHAEEQHETKRLSVSFRCA